MTDWKLNLNIKLGEIRYLGVPDISDYKLVHDSEIQNNGSNRLDEIHQYTDPYSTEYCRNMSEIFPIFHCNWNITGTFLSIIPKYFIATLQF